MFIENLASSNVFEKVILKFSRPEPNHSFNVDSSEVLRFLTLIRLGLSHLDDCELMYNFQDCLSLICSLDQEIETLKVH